MKLKRILMNEVDSSPGGGGVPAPASPAATAGTATPPPAPSATDITSAVAAQLAEFKNGFFADLRKAGALKQEKTEAPPTAQAANTGSPTTADVEGMLARERVIARAEAKHNLTDAQVKWMKSALAGVPAEGFAAAADSYMAEQGLVKAPAPTPPATATQTATTAPVAPTAPPAAAPSAPSAHALPTANGLPDLFNMTPAQHQALGPEGIKETLQRLWSIGNQASGAPARPKPPSQR